MSSGYWLDTQADDPYMMRSRSDWLPKHRTAVNLAREAERMGTPRYMIRESVNYPATLWWKSTFEVENLTVSALFRQGKKQYNFASMSGVIIQPNEVTIAHPEDMNSVLEWRFTVTDGALAWSYEKLLFEVQFTTDRQKIMIADNDSGGTGSAATGENVLTRRISFPNPRGWPPFLYADPLHPTQAEYKEAEMRAEARRRPQYGSYKDLPSYVPNQRLRGFRARASGQM